MTLEDKIDHRTKEMVPESVFVIPSLSFLRLVVGGRRRLMGYDISKRTLTHHYRRVIEVGT